MGMLTRGGLTAIIMRWASGLRFPWLFLVTAGLLALNLVIPDVIPFADEILMGLVALILANLKKKPDDNPPSGSSGSANRKGA